MSNLARWFRAFWLGALLGLALVPPASAASIGRVVVFGDSLSDPGNAFALLGGKVSVPPFQSLVPDAPYALDGHHFSNGPTWIEQIAQAGPAFQNPGVDFNYAVGGARARSAGPVDLTAQVSRYLADVGNKPSATMRHVILIGGDDVRDALAALATDPSGAQSGLILQQAIGVIQNNMLMLHSAGANRFLVANLPDVGLSPEAQQAGPVAQVAATLLTRQFNTGLEQMLAGLRAAGVSIVSVDVFALHHEVTALPLVFGLTNVTTACIRLNTTVAPYCDRPDKFLFWDGNHPTFAGHRLIGLRALTSLLVAHGLP